VKTYTFKTTATFYVTIEAETEEEAYEIAGDTDPINCETEFTENYDEEYGCLWKLVSTK
jgi:hypothetical protein